MAIDINLLRILKHKDDFYKVRGRVPDAALEQQTNVILKDFEKYFKKFPDHEVVDVSAFVTLFRAWHSNLKKESLAAYEGILKKMREDVPESNKDAILEQMLEIRLSSDVATLLAKFEDGDVDNFYGQLTELFDQHKLDAKITGIDFIRTDIGELLKQDEVGFGYSWRMDCLNSCMRPLRPGDFIVLAGRPDKGKTTFLASELTHIAGQLPGEQTVVWLNNEGPGGRIKQRVWQAALGIGVKAMIDMHNKGQLVPKFKQLMGGMINRIRIFDIHGMDIYAVERIIETNAAGVVVYDMIDKIRGFKDAARTDLALEAMYDWARELCVKYECVGIATSQISVEGAGLLFPQQHMLKDSKTGKQGACDAQIMIGASDNPGMDRVRGIGVVKNKLRIEGKPQDPQAQVQFKPEIARFVDIPMEEADEDALDETG